MPNTREKLIELLLGRKEVVSEVCENTSCKTCQYEKYGFNCDKAILADHLIANGVTVQELDGCEYCKEDSDGYRKMFGAFLITNPFHGNEWFIDTGHCKPRQICFCPMCGRRLPQPPKGE